MAKKFDISKEQLIELYVNKGMSVSDVAAYFGCGATTIQRHMKKFGIPRHPRSDKVIIPKELLVEMHINQHLTMYAIAKQLGCSSKTIANKFKKYDIKLHSNPRTRYQIDISKNRLAELYIDKEMPIAKIAQLLDCSRTQINQKLKEYEIDVRSCEVTIDEKELIDLYVNQRTSAAELAKIFDCSLPTITTRLEECDVELRTASERVKHALRIDEKTLRRLYIDEHISIPKLGDKFGVSHTVIRRLMIEYGIDRRSWSECKLGKYAPSWKGGKVTKICKQCGSEYKVNRFRENHSSFCSKPCQTLYQRGENAINWKGGNGRAPYCYKFNLRLKAKVRARDNFTCQLCGKTEIEELEERNHRLSAHHVHYLKSDGDPDLITLCGRCNLKVNYNRDKWEQHFTYLLAERGLLRVQQSKPLQQTLAQSTASSL